MMNFISLFAATPPAIGSTCDPNAGQNVLQQFLGFPNWYAYLKGVTTLPPGTGTPVCSPAVSGLSDVWLIVAAVIEILLHIAALAAVAFVIYGGVKYMTSQGSPDETTQARHTIINALVGLLISVIAAVVITFIAKNI